MEVDMNKTFFYIVILTFSLIGSIYGAALLSDTSAATENTEPITITPSPTPEEEVIVFDIIPTITPVPMTMPPDLIVATPTPKPEIFPIEEIRDLDYPEEDQRCLARMLGSVLPKSAIKTTELAMCEMVQNMVDSGNYKDTIRYTLLLKYEFFGYDPEARRTDEHMEVADYAMRTWYEVKLYGDRTHRLTPETGVHYKSVNDKYVVIYDSNWGVVYENVPEDIPY